MRGLDLSGETQEQGECGCNEQVSFWPEEDVYSSPRSPNVEDDRLSLASQLRKTKSMDASCLDMRSINDATSPLKPLSRAKSEFNLSASTHSLAQEPVTPTRPKSMAVPDRGGWDSPLARAMYAYLSSGDNQLSFLEGDIISLMGERNKGWQFGENLRTQCSGWFPLAYTELIVDDGISSPTHQRIQSFDSTGTSTTATTPATPTNHMSSSFGAVTSPTGGAALGHAVGTNLSGKSGTNPDTSRSAAAAVTMFGDTLAHRSTFSKQIRRGNTKISASVGPPPTLPAPVPTPKIPAVPSHPQTLPVTRTTAERRLIHPPPMPPLPTMLGNAKRAPGVIGSGIGNASLHSSNDSGFSNDPPPAPEVDYSDDDSSRKPSRNNTRSPITNNESPVEDVKDKRKKQLISSVRGWLLYKSALDLWDDVNNQYSNKTTTNNKLAEVDDTTSKATLTAAQAKHSNAIRQASSLGHLATLGRADNEVVSDGSRTNNHTIVKSTRADDTESIKGAPTVKRSKSLWKFKRSHKDSVILEGMSLWRHRSLVDVNDAVEKEEEHKKFRSTPVMKTKLVAMRTEESIETNVDDSGEESETSPINENTRFSRSSETLVPSVSDYHQNGHHIVKRPAMITGNVNGSVRTIDINDDGLMNSRHSNDFDTSDEEDNDENNNGEETESCIVVNDHTRASNLRKQQMNGGSLLPRTKLLRSSTLGSKENILDKKDEANEQDGLQEYGRSLKNRMKKPDRGSRFDHVSQTTGNMYGPWYDLWGMDSSVKTNILAKK
uniref:SH3 domain-containing protein n=1 Tax=Timema cristinae TaxID=61476 RepID=A0A7R9D5F8_TIMCR|nr:unnamed protein product [Timema cristinae]